MKGPEQYGAELPLCNICSLYFILPPTKLNANIYTLAGRLVVLLISCRVGAHIKERNAAKRTELGQHARVSHESSFPVEPTHLMLMSSHEQRKSTSSRSSPAFSVIDITFFVCARVEQHRTGILS